MPDSWYVYDCCDCHHRYPSKKLICHSKKCGLFHHSQECNPSLCPENHCGNQNIRRRIFSPTKVFLTPHVGFILQADANIKPGNLIRCYWGKLIDHHDFCLLSPIAYLIQCTSKLVFLTDSIQEFEVGGLF